MKEPEEEFEEGEGEYEEEEIPEPLKKKWRKREQEGLSGSNCRSCGAALTEENLVCPVCRTPAELEETLGLTQWLFGNWIGWTILAVVTAAVILTLAQI